MTNRAQQAKADEKAKASREARPRPDPPRGRRAGARRSPRSSASPATIRPASSVPLRPATVEDRRRLEAVRLYTAARGLEDRGLWTDAVALLQEASKLDPDSVAIARRLAKIYIGALGRPDLAIAVRPSRPRDRAGRYRDPLQAGGLLFASGASPRPPRRSSRRSWPTPSSPRIRPGRLVAEFELGRLYSTRLKQLDKAADAFAKVIEDLDDKSANRLSPGEQHRILGNDPATAYLNFGMIFLAAKRDELVVKAFERGLVYDEDNPQIALLLAETLLRLHKPRAGPGAGRPRHPASAAGRRGVRPAGQGAQGAGPREGDHAAARGGRPSATARTCRSSTSWPIATARPARSRRPRPCTSRC